jgi:hypothetical protein
MSEASDKVVQLPPRANDPSQWMIGPFEEYRVVVDGRRIPGLTAFRDGPDNIALVVDGRFSVSLPAGRAYDVAWLLANAMAVASGYPWLGAETKSRPFAPLCSELKRAD